MSGNLANKSLREIFEDIFQGNIAELDVIRIIKTRTDQYDPVKLKVLQYDLLYFKATKERELKSKYNIEDSSDILSFEKASLFRQAEGSYTDLIAEQMGLFRLEQLKLKVNRLVKEYEQNITNPRPYKTADLKDVSEVVQKLKNRTRNTDTAYDEDVITFVMNFARTNANEGNIAKIVRLIRKHPDYPEVLKNRVEDPNDTRGPERNWIKYYDKEAGITRR